MTVAPADAPLDRLLRLSAYVSPFRRLLPEDQQIGRHLRSDRIEPGVAWSDVEVKSRGVVQLGFLRIVDGLDAEFEAAEARPSTATSTMPSSPHQ